MSQEGADAPVTALPVADRCNRNGPQNGAQRAAPWQALAVTLGLAALSWGLVGLAGALLWRAIA